MGDTNFRIVFMMMIAAGLAMLPACSSSTWEDAKQANTYKAYQGYVQDHPDGKHTAEARARADSLYWQSIKNDTTAASFNKYLNAFPKGQYRSRAQAKINHPGAGNATKARVTGSNVIIRSNHTTESPSKGVVAKEGTAVQILDRYSSGNSNEAILKQGITVQVHGRRIQLAKGKAIRILEDNNESVRASFTTRQFGPANASIDKSAIEAMGEQQWYKIHTTDGITGWIYGKFIEEL